MTTITEAFSPRLGVRYWAVVWGLGLTQTAICLSEAEAVALANGGRRQSVEPLVSFR